MTTIQNILFPVDFSPSCLVMAPFVKRAASIFGAGISWGMAISMVPGARIELATPAFSGRRSTNELPRHIWSFLILETIVGGVNSASARTLSPYVSSRQRIARPAQNKFANRVPQSPAMAPK